MIRPRLRPTVSRRIKYIGVAPTAQKKLGKEARRGSHDLRRLVGHANFLDVLVDNLDNGEDDAGASETIPEVNEDVNASHEEFEELESDSDSDGDSIEWSDDENDEDHALGRTASGRPLGNASGKPPDAEDDDYFSHAVRHSTATLSADDIVGQGGYAVDDNETASVMASSSQIAELLEDIDTGDNKEPALATLRDVSASERPKVQRNQS